MAEEKVQKIYVPRASLPPMNADTESYLYRYRVISEDRNQVSHWTPIQSVQVSPVTPLSLDQYSIRKNDSTNSNDVVLVWSTPSELVGALLDVYVRWSSNDAYAEETDPNGLVAHPWEYVASTSGPQFSIIIPETITNYFTENTAILPKHVMLALQTPTYPKKRVANATLLQTPMTNI